MMVMQCAACGESVSIDEHLGSGQRCPSCGESVGKLPIREVRVSTALDDLQEGVKPISFGAYSKAADAAWDDPFETRVEEQVANLVADEAVIDNAVVNAVPAEVQARFKARQREVRKKLMWIGLVVVVVVIGLIAFILY